MHTWLTVPRLLYILFCALYSKLDAVADSLGKPNEELYLSYSPHCFLATVPSISGRMSYHY